MDITRGMYVVGAWSLPDSSNFPESDRAHNSFTLIVTRYNPQFSENVVETLKVHSAIPNWCKF